MELERQMKSMELEKEQQQQGGGGGGGRGVAGGAAHGRGGRGRGARGRGWNSFSHGEHDDRIGGPEDGDLEYVRQSSDTSWGRPGEGKVEQQWGKKDRRGDRQVQERHVQERQVQERQVQERQVHERQEVQVQDLQVQLQGGQRTVVDQEESSEGPVADLRSKLSQKRGEGGNKDLREDLNNRRAAGGGGGEEGDERPLSPREQQRKAAAEERERLRNRARGGGGGGQQRGGSGGQQRGGKGPGGNQQHQQQGRGGGQHHGGRQNGRGGEHESGSRVQVNNHQNGVQHHEPHQQQQHGKQGGGKQQIPRPKKNTENFNPSHEAPPMRILVAPPGLKRYHRANSTRDVIIVSDLFGSYSDLTIYKNLLYEVQNSGVPQEQLWQSWHGDSHLIADDKRNWKEQCPTFAMILNRIRDYFDMDIKATRLNWYRDTSEWKPFHHDAAAMKPDKARTQNFTVAVSFGCERDAAFEHAESKTVVSMPQPNGTIYTFGKDVNLLWRHGILQVPPSLHKNEGRISIIAWGWVPQYDL